MRKLPPEIDNVMYDTRPEPPKIKFPASLFWFLFFGVGAGIALFATGVYIGMLLLGE